MQKRNKLLALLLSFVLVASLFPFGLQASANADWLTTGRYYEDFEGDTTFVLDTQRSGVYETCNKNAYSAPRGTIVPNTVAGGSVNTSANVFKAEGLNSFNSTWGNTWDGGEAHTGFQIFTPDIWAQVAENGLQLQQAALDSMLTIGRSYQYIVYYKWNSSNVFAFFSLYTVKDESTGIYRLEVEDNVKTPDGWTITPVYSGTNTDTFGDAWSTLKLRYGEDGYVSLSVYNALNDLTYNYKTVSALSAEDQRYFAVTTTQYGAALVDNVRLCFSDQGIAEDFKAVHQTVLQYASGAEPLPEDMIAVVKAFNQAKADYAALPEAAKAYLTEESAWLERFEQTLNNRKYLDGDVCAIDFENGETLLHDTERSGVFTAQNNQAQVYKLAANPYPDSLLNRSANVYQIATHQENASAWIQNNFQIITPDIWQTVQQEGMQLQSVTLDTSLNDGITYGQIFYYKYNSKTDWAAFVIGVGGDQGNLRLGIRNYYCTDAVWQEIENGTRRELPFYQLLNVFNESESAFTAGFSATWSTVNLQYEDSGNVVLKIYCANNGKTFSFNSGMDLAAEDTRFFAISNVAHGTMYVDHLRLYFTQDAYISAFTEKYADIIAIGGNLDLYPSDEEGIAAVDAALAAFDLDYPRLSDAAQADSRIIAAKGAVETVKSAIADDRYMAQLKAFTTTYADVLAHVDDNLTVTDAGAEGLAEQTQAALEAFAALEAEVRALPAATQVLKRLNRLAGYIRYSALTQNGVYTQDFEQGNDFAPYASYPEYPETEIGTVNDHPKNGVLPNADNTTAYKIKSVITNNGGFHDADLQKYGQFITADAALFQVMADNGKYLSFGSFDLYLTANVFTEHEIVCSFTDAYNFEFLGLYANWLAENGIERRNYTVSGNSEDHSTAHFPDQKVFRVYGQDPTGQWYHFNYFYDEQGAFHLIMTDQNGLISVLAGPVGVAPERRILAFGSMGDREQYYIDNVEMHFTAGGYSAEAESARAFLSQKSFLRDVMEMDTQTIAPYDFTRISGFINSYEALSPAAAALIGQPITARIGGLQAQMAKWNTESDTAIAQSFTAIYPALDASAYRVYQRLTAAQKALLQTEYNQMQANVNAAAADDTVDIACIGDSITAGFGATQIEVNGEMVTPSYPYRLQEKLGSGYNVRNFGTSGIRILDAYDFAISSSTDGQYKGSEKYDQSLHMQPDMVIIMLGTNDLQKFVSVNTEASRQQLKTAYTDLVHSYLSLAGNPAVLLATIPEQRDRTHDADGINSLVSGIIYEVADTYGLPVIDIYAMTSAWTNEQLGEYFGDQLHPNNTGYERLADLFANYIRGGEQQVNTAAACTVDFSKVQYAQYAPQILGASISTDASAQRIWFKSAMGYAKSGAELVEYGTIFTYKQYLDNNTVTEADLVYGTQSPYVSIASAAVTSLGYGEQFIGNTFRIAEENYGVRVIARSYVRYADGSIYYSVNSTPGGSIDQATGAENGYAVRSIIGISKSIMGWTYRNRDHALLESLKTTLGDYITDYDAATGKFTWTQAAKENNGLPIIRYICENAAVISKAIETIGQ